MVPANIMQVREGSIDYMLIRLNVEYIMKLKPLSILLTIFPLQKVIYGDSNVNTIQELSVRKLPGREKQRPKLYLTSKQAKSVNLK